MNFIPYNPGSLPSKPAIVSGDIVEFEVQGYPPYKDTHFSIRNVNHKDHQKFLKLREAGIVAMNGRAWSHSPIQMDFRLYAPAFEKGKALIDYAGGIEDTLDGSSGYTFTYLPIIFEDDCQICAGNSQIILCNEVRYHLRFEVLKESSSGCGEKPG